MKPPVNFEVFEEATKLEVVYGIIVKTEDIPKSERLVKLTVDFGSEFGEKIILSGIKQEVENIEEFTGKGAFFALNITPRKMMGVISEGMILPFNMPKHPFLLSKGNHGGEFPKGLKLF